MNAGTFKRILFGLMLIGFGLLFLASQLGMISIDWGQIFPTFWPVILIYFGLSGMASSGRNSTSLFWNGFVALLGIVFLLRNLGFLYVSIGDLVKMAVPAAIILYGVKLIFQNGSSKGKPKTGQSDNTGGNPDAYKYDYSQSPPPPPPPPPSALDEQDARANAAGNADAQGTYQAQTDGKADGFAGWQEPNGGAWQPGTNAGTAGWQAGGGSQGSGAQGGHGGSAGWQHGNRHANWYGAEERNGFIGDLHLGRDYWELKPMNINHFIGDTVIDLTKAQIPFGETKLTISAFIGDVKVLVPNESDLSFRVNSSSFLGDIRVFDRHAGGFLRSLNEQLPDYADADRKINLQCNLFIGDIQVMRVG